MRLYHVPGTRSNRIYWMLEEAGLPYELETISREARHEPEHLARHPLGRVPVVHDGTGHVFESAGLALHIADLAPEKGLAAPLGSHDRALQYQWLFFAMIEMEPGVVERYLWGANGMFGNDAARDAAGLESYRKAAQLIEDALAGKEYLVGNRFSVADVIVGGVCGFGAYLGMNDGFPNIAAYLERLHARPAYQKANS